MGRTGRNFGPGVVESGAEKQGTIARISGINQQIRVVLCIGIGLKYSESTTQIAIDLPAHHFRFSLRESS
jgi:hypothetical protein